MRRVGLYLSMVLLLALALRVISLDIAFLHWAVDHGFLVEFRGGEFQRVEWTAYDLLMLAALYGANFFIFWAAWWIRNSLRTQSQTYRQTWPPGSILFPGPGKKPECATGNPVCVTESETPRPGWRRSGSAPRPERHGRPRLER